MKRFATALWSAAVVLLAVAGYFFYQAGSLADRLHAKQILSAPATVQNAGAQAGLAAATTSQRSSTSSPAEPGGLPSNTLRVKLASDSPHSREKMTYSSVSPEANIADAGIRVRTRFHALYAQLGLGPEQIVRFEEEMRKKNYAVDIFVTLIGASPEQLEHHVEAQLAQVDEIVRDTLGEAQIAAVRRYIATADIQEFTDKLAVATFASEAPLTAQQADQLMQTCLALRANPDQPVHRIDLRAIDWDAVVDRARGFLAPGQMTMLQALLDRKQFDFDYSDVTDGGRRPPVRNF